MMVALERTRKHEAAVEELWVRCDRVRSDEAPCVGTNTHSSRYGIRKLSRDSETSHNSLSLTRCIIQDEEIEEETVKKRRTQDVCRGKKKELSKVKNDDNVADAHPLSGQQRASGFCCCCCYFGFLCHCHHYWSSRTSSQVQTHRARDLPPLRSRSRSRQKQ